MGRQGMKRPKAELINDPGHIHEGGVEKSGEV